MELRLFEDFSKKHNSTKRPSGGYTHEVRMKQGTSIESPVFLIDGINLNVNYCQFAGHYYFIEDIILSNNNIYELHCRQDLLATYKDYIGNYTAFVERSASNYNVNLYDNAVTCSEQFTNLSAGRSNLTWYDSTGCYIVRILGAHAVAGRGGITSYVMNATEVKNLMDIVYASAGSSIFDDIIDKGDEAEKALARAIFKPSQYLLSMHWLPVSKDRVASGGQTVFLGSYNTGRTASYVTSIGFTSDTGISVPSNYYGDFRDITEPFTTYNLFLGGIGLVPISAKDITTGMKAAYSIDFLTGDTEVEVFNSDTHIVSSYKTNIAVPIPIAGMVADVGGVVSSIATGAAASIFTGNPLGVVGGLVKGTVNAMQPTPSVIGSQGSMTSIHAFPYVILSKRVMASGALSTNVYGRPLCQNVQINSLSGFVKCAAASIDIPSMGNDREDINAFLNNGFYFE